MSRSNYTEDCDGWAHIRWRGAVASAIRGMRGQQLLHGLASALDAMPEKRLIAESLITAEGEVCALGSLGVACGKADAMREVDPEDPEQVARFFGVSDALVREIQFENDEGSWADRETPEERWERMRRWVNRHLIIGAPHVQQ